MCSQVALPNRDLVVSLASCLKVPTLKHRRNESGVVSAHKLKFEDLQFWNQSDLDSSTACL